MADRNGYIGRAPGDSSVVIARQSFEPTGIQTNFTFSSGYTVGYLDAYFNGVRLIEANDYTATDGSGNTATASRTVNVVDTTAPVFVSTGNFTMDENELKKTQLNYGQNKRSKDHIGMFGNKPFSMKDHKKYLTHENINNLLGLEIDLVYEWELGSMLIFDRTRLHCSSCNIDGKKIGLTTFTKK